jgi:hypothetical protein
MAKLTDRRDTMIATTKGFTRWAGLILAVSLPLISTQAHAQTTTVTVGGFSYELSNSYSAFDRDFARDQPWWGDESLALDFAIAINFAGIPWSGNSAFFSYNTGNMDGIVHYAYANGSLTGLGSQSFSVSSNYVTATLAASSVPEINAGSMSQALLILFALWLVTWRRPASRVA